MKYLILIPLLALLSSSRSPAQEMGSVGEYIQVLLDKVDSLDLIYSLIIDAEQVVERAEPNSTMFRIAMHDVHVLAKEFSTQLSEYSGILDSKLDVYEETGLRQRMVSHELPKLRATHEAQSIIVKKQKMAVDLSTGTIVGDNIVNSSDVILMDAESGTIEFASDHADSNMEIGFAEIGTGFGMFTRSKPLYEPGLRTLSTLENRPELKKSINIAAESQTNEGSVVYCKGKEFEVLLMLYDHPLQARPDTVILRWRKLKLDSNNP